MSTKKWLLCQFILSLAILIVFGGLIVFIDPFFHYHAPFTERFYYSLGNERSQNDGIAKHFDYDSVIIGSSMAQNFKTSEFDSLFNMKSIKLPYAGASYKEIDESIRVALDSNEEKVLTVVRTIDMGMFFQNKDTMRFDLGYYPSYLYDSNPFNDYKYVLNKDIMLNYCYPMVKNAIKGDEPGITSFDRYGSWMPSFEGKFGKDYVLEGRDLFANPENIISLSNNDKVTVVESIEQNVIDTCKDYPKTEFYLILSPYSIAWWGNLYSEGLLDRELEAEALVIETILSNDCENIHLFSLNTEFDITTNLDNYKDPMHYGEWINSVILKYLRDGKCELTKDNYRDYLREERTFLHSFDFNSLFE